MYREPGLACPTCRGVLRPYGKRLVCDACGGLLIAIDELAVELADVGGLNVEVEDRETLAGSCPRCGGPLVGCEVSAAGLRFAGLARCSRDGLWIAGDQLGHMIETIFRQEHRGRWLGRFYGGRAQAKGSGLAISRWWEKARPRVHTPFRSAFRGQRLACPTCADTSLALVTDRWVCNGCAGTFVEDAALIAMISDLVREPWEPPEPAGRAGERKCPVCARAMTEEAFESVTVARCAGHGHWFADPDLQVALEHAGIRRS